jgi:putative transposase
MIKGVTAKEIFKERPEAKERLWGGEFWSAGRYVAGEYGGEGMTANYVKWRARGKGGEQPCGIRADESQPSLFE